MYRALDIYKIINIPVLEMLQSINPLRNDEKTNTFLQKPHNMNECNKNINHELLITKVREIN